MTAPVFEYEAPKGQRLHRYFVWIHIDNGDQEYLWFGDKTRRWSPDIDKCGAGSAASCRTFCAFKSHLRRHADALKGRRVTLVSRFVGYDITVQL